MITLSIQSNNTATAYSMSEPRKNFGLSENAFELLVEKLQSGDEELVQVIFKSHFEVCRRFLMKQLNATYDDAYDITKETLIKFRMNLIAGKINYGNLAALFTVDAKNNFLKLAGKRNRVKVNDINEATLNIADDSDDPVYDEVLLQQLKTALTKLCHDCRELLDWHYYLGMPQREIAQNRLRRGDVKFVQEDAVKSKLAECRKKLKKLL